MSRQSRIKHIREFGAYGLSTWNAGLTIEQAKEIGPEVVHRSLHTNFKKGDKVLIHGTSETIEVLDVQGKFLTLKSFGDGSVKAFRDASCSYGSYSYGRIKIFCALCLLKFE